MNAAAASAALVLLHGLVTIGPTSASCVGSTSCTKPSAHTLIEFVRYRHVAFVRTDAQGRYQVKLSPGTWMVNGVAGVRTIPDRIIVRSVPSMRRDFRLDSGIR